MASTCECKPSPRRSARPRTMAKPSMATYFSPTERHFDCRGCNKRSFYLAVGRLDPRWDHVHERCHLVWSDGRSCIELFNDLLEDILPISALRLFKKVDQLLHRCKGWKLKQAERIEQVAETVAY